MRAVSEKKLHVIRVMLTDKERNSAVRRQGQGEKDKKQR
jgi:hypothetical protein